MGYVGVHHDDREVRLCDQRDNDKEILDSESDHAHNIIIVEPYGICRRTRDIVRVQYNLVWLL